MSKESILPRVSDLPRLNVAQLQAAHRLMFGAEHPIANCQHLRRKIAWHVQAPKEGGLPESVRQYAIAIARGSGAANAHLGERVPATAGIPLEQAVTTTVTQPQDARLPMPGSLIVKKYKDRTLVVKVLDGGFEYEGRRFTSLSAIAGEITGTRWNGFAFFGLDKEARRASLRNGKKENGNGSAEHAVVRCAIYTRKSTEEGLDQAFNTLDAQREAAEAYINSQRQEGWVALPQKYDDGGYTGANMDRPALKRLLADVESGVANCVVVYKVDRLTRSLLDSPGSSRSSTSTARPSSR